MELRQIRYALSVAKERSFTRASKRLNISQSAVSAQIKLLEGEVGFPLFRRGTRGIELTEAGRTFLHEAERIISDSLNLAETARRLRGDSYETLNLGMVSGVPQTFVPHIFRDFSNTIRDVKLRILIGSTRRIFQDVQEEKIDAGIALESDSDRIPAGLVYDRLALVDMVLIVPRKHPLAKSKSPIDIATLVNEPIVMNELEVGYGQIVLSLFADIGVRPNILAIADNVETIKTIVQSGAGIAILPRCCAEGEVSNRLLSALPFVPKRSVTFSLFRRREPLSRAKEHCISTLGRLLRLEPS
jgi:DNA-binding transcriptional LysR family regulator